LGNACGVDLIHIAYCDLSGLSLPAIERLQTEYKWVAEDVLFMESIRSLWRRDGKAGSLWRLAKGKRIYGIWSPADPLPFIAYVPGHCLAEVTRAIRSRLRSGLSRPFAGEGVVQKPASREATQQVRN
jgi:hypothetical protein